MKTDVFGKFLLENWETIFQNLREFASWRVVNVSLRDLFVMSFLKFRWRYLKWEKNNFKWNWWSDGAWAFGRRNWENFIFNYSVCYELLYFYKKKLLYNCYNALGGGKVVLKIGKNLIRHYMNDPPEENKLQN